MRKLLLALFAGALLSSPALANWTGKDATSATITFYNPGVCTSVVCVPVAQLTDGTNQVTLTTAGADGVSNTLTGLPTYARMLQFNGTTWDRWQGAVKAGSGAFASGSIASGAMVDLGSQGDAACASDSGSCSLIALQKRSNQNLTTINSNVQAPPPLGTTNGWTPKLLNGLTNTATAVKASGGWVGKLYCYNPNASAAYVQIFNVASGSVTVGATTPLQSYGFGPTSSSGFIMPVQGDQYSTAISVAATTTATGGTAPGTALDCNISFN